MKQQTQGGFERHGRATGPTQLLSEMDWIVLWSELVAVVEPFYRKAPEPAVDR